MNKIFCKDIENITLKNKNYRKVAYTHDKGMQFVLMSIRPGEEIGMEIHQHIDQFIRIESGMGELHIKKNNKIKKYKLKDGIGFIIPSKTYHNVLCTGKEDLKLYTIYSKPSHEDGLVEKNKN